MASKIDRFFIRDGWTRAFPELSLSLASRVTSDHFPIQLECKHLKWDLLFRFKNMWLNHQKFHKAKIWWGNFKKGWEGYKIMGRLKSTKNKPKILNKYFGI